MAAPTSYAAPRSLTALHVRLGARLSLVCLVVGSTVIRSLVGISRPAPDYFPDEYIYTALSRSIAASGRPLVRGEAAHFPALLEPLLAAPLWAIGSVETAYRLVQFQNAFFISLAAVPAYLLARRLDLGSGFALACAAFALLIPDVAFASFITADAVAYPLVLTALLFGVKALQAPGRLTQLAFVVLAGAATFARVQFAVLAPAFVVAAILLDRRSALRIHRLPLILFSVAAAGLVAVGPGRDLGYYHAVLQLQVAAGFFGWAGLDLLFLSLAGAVVLVPGAVLGLLTAKERRDRAFAALVLPFSLALMVEAALYAGNGSDRFKERYLFVLLPLLPIAFGLYRRQGRPMRAAVVALAASIAIAAAAIPLSGYVRGEGFDDSPLLWSYLELQRRLGDTDARLVFASGVIVGAALAVAATWSRFAGPALAGALVLALALSVGASQFQNEVSQQLRRQLVAGNPSWVDAAHVGPVSAIETDLAPSSALTEQLFWNRSIRHELLLGSRPEATDPMATGQISVAPDGTLLVAARGTPGARERLTPLSGAFLFQGLEVSAGFAGAVPVARYSSFTLWRPTGAARLVTYELGRYWDGWLAPQGGLEVWPSGARGGTVSFTLSLPAGRPAPVTVRVGTRSYRLNRGRHVRVAFRIPGGRSWSLRFSTTAGAARLPDNRPVSVRSTAPVFTPA